MGLNSKKLLKSLIGKKLSQVKRYVFVADYAFYDPEIRDQESDGPTESCTMDGMVFHIVSNTKQMAIEFISGPCPRQGESYVTLNAFGQPERTRVSSISMLFSRSTALRDLSLHLDQNFSSRMENHS